VETSGGRAIENSGKFSKSSVALQFSTYVCKTSWRCK